MSPGGAAEQGAAKQARAFSDRANSGWGQAPGCPLPIASCARAAQSYGRCHPLAAQPFALKDRPAKWPRKTTEKATGRPTHLVQDLSSIPHLT